MDSSIPLHEAVGRNVDAYSGVQDLDAIMNLGPQNLTCTTLPAVPDLVNTSGNSSGLYSETTASLTDSEKPQVISPGLVTDLSMGVLSDGGYDVQKMNVTDYKGYVNHFQEMMLETALNQRAICLINDLGPIESYLDKYISVGTRYTVDGSTYSLVNGRIVAQDYRFQTRVRRTESGQMIIDPTSVYLPELVSDFTPSVATHSPELAYDTPPTLPSLTSDILSTRFTLHRQLAEKTESFLWLLDTQYHPSPAAVHPLDLPESRTVQLSATGGLIISRTSANRLASAEGTFFCGSKKAWLNPVAEFSMLNPEKCRRMFVYLGLSVLKVVYNHEVLAIVRKFLSDCPLFQLRECVLFLLGIVTDLSEIPSHLLRIDTPVYEMLQRAILDSLYFGSSNRPSYNAPIDFNPDSLTHWLATSKLVTTKVLSMFRKQYLLPTHVDPETAEARTVAEDDLLEEVLPHLDLDLMLISPMERHLGSFCYKNHSKALVPQVTGQLSASTPIELIPYIDNSGPTLAVNVLHEAGYKLLLQMLKGDVTSPLPQFSALAMEDIGLIYALTHIPIRLHVSDKVVLNRNQEATGYMLTLLRLLSTDRYASVFALNRCLYLNTAPKPDHWALGCYSGVGKTCTRDQFEDLETVMSKYDCDYCTLAPEERLSWLCAAVSEVLEMHPGYLDFGTSFDMLVMHSYHVTRSMEFVKSHTLSNGRVLKDFIVTDNGILADTDLQKPGTKLFLITGYAKHSDLYKRLNPGGWTNYTRQYPNPKYSGLRAMVFSFALLVNPDQERDLIRGKMALDLHPKVTSPWCTVFLDCWNMFVDMNPCTKVLDLYRTVDGLFYGSLTDHAVAEPLLSYRGLPLLLSHYHDRLSHYIRQIIILSKMKLTDVDADVPLDCDAVRKHVDGRFGKTGRLVLLGDDPMSSFNLLLGQLVLTLWEMVDSFNLIGVPRDPKKPLAGKWCLLDFVPKNTVTFVLQNYTRISNCTPDFVLADIGSDLDGDYGTMQDYVSIKLDRGHYPYTHYHFNLTSLGPKLLQYVRYVQGISTGFGGPKPAFRGNPAIRVQPSVTNLLAAEDTAANMDYSTMLPALAKLQWNFHYDF